MARKYSRSKGKAKSTRPVERQVPAWQNYKPAEVEALILKLVNQGKSASHIRLTMRASYGLPDIQSTLKKTLTNIPKEK